MILILLIKLITILSFAGCILIWYYPIRTSIIDSYRFDLFGLRSELYKIGREEKINFDNELYRALEKDINTFIRYAHWFSFTKILIALFAYKFSPIILDNKKQKKKSYKSFNYYLKKYKKEINEDVYRELSNLHIRLNKRTYKFVNVYSPLNIILLNIYTLGRKRKYSSYNEKLKRRVIEKDILFANYIDEVGKNKDTILKPY
ncbi:MAG TPA: hypothetical protein VE912_09110 [Bacteroidales bacterium]|nr:hypothetical protein [Bacteroidales bacterium]